MLNGLLFCAKTFQKNNRPISPKDFLSERKKKSRCEKENLAFSESEAFLHFISKQPKVKRDICFVFRNRAIAKFFHFGLKKSFSKSNFFFFSYVSTPEKIVKQAERHFFVFVVGSSIFFQPRAIFDKNTEGERERERERACMCVFERESEKGREDDSSIIATTDEF